MGEKSEILVIFIYIYQDNKHFYSDVYVPLALRFFKGPNSVYFSQLFKF